MRALLLVLTLFATVAFQRADAQTPRRGFLFKDTRGDLATARARGDKDASLVIASMPGANVRVAKLIGTLGGSIQVRDDDVDYLRARVPLDKIDVLATNADVHSVNISSAARFPSGGAQDTTIEATDTTTTTRVWPPPLVSTYPITHRYDPRTDLRAMDFLKSNPTWDGRGVTLAIIDMSFDPLLPELQTAMSLDGKPIQKIIGYESVIDPDEENEGRWLRMTDTVVASGGHFSYKGRTYTAPRDGRFHVDLLDESTFDSLSSPAASGKNQFNKDLNRDGNPAGSSRLFAVLWDDKTDDVWVDTNQNGSFTDEKQLGDFATHPEFGVFGTDDPKTAVRESIGFGVQVDKKRKMVALNIGVAWHSSLVVGAAAASKGRSGKFDGVAPGAQLVDVAEGCQAYGQTEAVIRAMKNPKVDIVWLEHCNNITRPYTLRDGRLTTTVIYDRLIAKYHKILMVPTHNYPVLGGTDDIVMARGAIGVGGHEGKENFFVNHGVRVKYDDNLLITGGYGPMGNGTFGPDIISPSNYISTARGWEEPVPIAGGLYRLPPGYIIAGGTSTATPTAAGAVALLVSAAKQTGVKYDPDRIKYAIVSSARYVSHIPAYKQGSGVIDVGAAWKILRALDSVPVPPTIVSSAPVKHPFSGALVRPNEGSGFYERGGWSAGQSGERTFTFTRTSGGAAPMAFSVNWVGNDDATYASPTTITLPLNTPVPLRVTVAPKGAGAHTAMLTLTNPRVPGFAHRMLATVVVGDSLTAGNRFTNKIETNVPRPEMRSFFYTVPAGLAALRVEIDQPTRDVGVSVVKPDTRTANATRVAPAGRGGGEARARKATYVVTDPMPGVWEVVLSDLADTQNFDRMQAESDKPAPPTPVTLTVSAISVESNAATTAGGQDGGATSDQLHLRNTHAAFTGALATLPLGAARRERATLGARQQKEYTIDVPAGSAMLMVRATHSSANVDIYLFDCTGKICLASQQAIDPSGEETLVVQNPAKGTWKVVVDAPESGATFDYLDAIFNPAFGVVGTSDVAKEHATADQWTAQMNVWKAGTLPAGRDAFGLLSLLGQMSPGATYPLGFIEVPRP